MFFSQMLFGNMSAIWAQEQNLLMHTGSNYQSWVIPRAQAWLAQKYIASYSFGGKEQSSHFQFTCIYDISTTEWGKANILDFKRIPMTRACARLLKALGQIPGLELLDSDLGTTTATYTKGFRH